MVLHIREQIYSWILLFSFVSVNKVTANFRLKQHKLLIFGVLEVRV